MTNEKLRWQIGMLVTIILAVVSIVINRPTVKGLTYRTSKFNRLVQKHKYVSDSLRIYFGDRELGGLYTTSIQIKNAGNQEIIGTDFENPIEITFPKDLRVLDIGIYNSQPSNIRPKAEIRDKNRIIVQPLLLNPKDEFTILVFTDTIAQLPTVKSRIRGQREILGSQESYVKFYKPKFVIWVFAVFGIILMFLAAFILAKSYYSDKLVIGISNNISSILFLILSVSGLALLGYWGEEVNYSLHWVYRLIFGIVGLGVIFFFAKPKKT